MAQTTLQTAVSTSRTGSLLSKLQIGSDLYNIKDPSVEALALATDAEFDEVKSSIQSLQTATTWTAVTKDEGAAKFATSVTQDTDGSIEVTYGTIRESALAKDANAKKFATAVTQTVDGVVSATYDDATTTDIIRTASSSDTTHNGLSSTTLEAALQELDALIKAEAGARTQGDADLLGTSEDDENDNTIWGAKAYADAKVQELAGEDWTTAAATVKNIIDELSESGNADLSTVVDKVRGDFTVGEGAGATTDIKHYIDAKVAAAESAASGGITDLDAVVRGNLDTNDAVTTGHKVGVKVTEVDGVITDVTVVENDIASESAVNAKIGNLGTKVVNDETVDLTVKEYVDNSVAGKNVSASSSSTDYITASASNNAVTIGATTKTTDAIAAAETSIQSLTVNGQTATISGNANAKAASVTVYGDQIDLTTSDGTKVTTAIANLNSSKANKDAITSANVNNWSTGYDSASEKLTWTNTVTSVYVPVANQSL